jgi:hypothetical protein
MSTAKQRAANKENARHSTGPVTPEGKAISSRNRVSAGFNSTVTYFIDGEKEDQFWQLLEDFTNQYQPANPTEQVLLEKMIHNQWLSLRAIRYQRNRLFPLGYNNPLPADFGLLIRYQTAADRAFHKAHAELVKAQNERKKSEIGFVSQTADPAPPAAPEPPAKLPQKATAPPPETPAIAVQPEIVPSEPELTPEIADDGETFSQAA